MQTLINTKFASDRRRGFALLSHVVFVKTFFNIEHTPFISKRVRYKFLVFGERSKVLTTVAFATKVFDRLL